MVDQLLAALKDGVVPHDKLMIETDAPYMGFKGCRQGKSRPSRTFPNTPDALPFVLRALSDAIQIPPIDVAAITTRNAMDFFKMELL